MSFSYYIMFHYHYNWPGLPRGRLPFYSSQQSRAGSMPPGEERARLWLIHFFMTASRRVFPGENFTLFRAGIVIAVPVAGLCPRRALHSLLKKEPTPGHVILSPSAMHIFRISPKALIALAASVTRSPPLAATALINSCLFIAFVFYCSCLILYAGFSCPRVSGRKETEKAPFEALSPKRVARVPLHLRHVYPVQPLPTRWPGRPAAGGFVTWLYPARRRLPTR